MTSTNTAFAHADAFHAECRAVADFIDQSVRPIVDRKAAGTPEHDTYKGALLRITGWLRSLAKLNHPGDFQATAAACRSMFEIAVDLTLLAHVSSEKSDHIRSGKSVRSRERPDDA